MKGIGIATVLLFAAFGCWLSDSGSLCISPRFHEPKVGRPVLDNTGLHGTYFFVLPRVEAHFGLKFEAEKAAADVLVIGHVEKPDVN